MDDPRRFVLASEFLPSFVLYYDVSDNVYAMNDLSAATVFKKSRVPHAAYFASRRGSWAQRKPMSPLRVAGSVQLRLADRRPQAGV